MRELAAAIARDHPGGELLIVAIFKGGFMFLADLLRALAAHQIAPLVDFLMVSSYGAGTRSSGRPRLQGRISVPVRGRQVLLVDDILDTGLTLQTVRRHLVSRGAHGVRVCVLLVKQRRRQTSSRPDYVGFRVPRVFVVGYGLDHGGRYRQLPYLAALTAQGPDGGPGP